MKVYRATVKVEYVKSVFGVVPDEASESDMRKDACTKIGYRIDPEVFAPILDVTEVQDLGYSHEMTEAYKLIDQYVSRETDS